MSPRGADLAGWSASPQQIRNGTRPSASALSVARHRSTVPVARSLPVAHLTWVVAVAAGLGHREIDVVTRERRAGQHAAGKVVYPKGSRPGGFGLPGVGRDDLQVRPRAEREQRVVSAEADVLAALARTPKRSSKSATAAVRSGTA